MMRRRDVVAGLAAGVAAGVAGAFLPSRVVAAGVSPAEAEVKALPAVEGPAAAFIVQEVGPQEVGGPAREALGVGAVDVRQPPHSTFQDLGIR